MSIKLGFCRLGLGIDIIYIISFNKGTCLLFGNKGKANWYPNNSVSLSSEAGEGSVTESYKIPPKLYSEPNCLYKFGYNFDIPSKSKKTNLTRAGTIANCELSKFWLFTDTICCCKPSLYKAIIYLLLIHS